MVLRDNGAALGVALLFVVSERPAFWLARKSHPARSPRPSPGRPERSGGPAERRLTAVGPRRDEIDHQFRSKPITRSDGNRSPVGAKRRGTWNHESRFSRFLSPVGVIAWTLPSCRAWLDASTGTDLRMLDAGRRGRPGALPDFEEEDDGLWALWETALFAVFQAPVGAVFASMGAAASTAPRGAPAVLLGPGRARTQRRGGGGTPVPAGPREPPRARQTEAVRDVWPVICRRQAGGTAVMSPGCRSGSRAGAVCASSLP